MNLVKINTHSTLVEQLFRANDLFAQVTGFNPTHYFRQYLPVYQTHTPGKKLPVTNFINFQNSRHLASKHDPLCPDGTVTANAEVRFQER